MIIKILCFLAVFVLLPINPALGQDSSIETINISLKEIKQLIPNHETHNSYDLFYLNNLERTLIRETSAIKSDTMELRHYVYATVVEDLLWLNCVSDLRARDDVLYIYERDRDGNKQTYEDFLFAGRGMKDEFRIGFIIYLGDTMEDQRQELNHTVAVRDIKTGDTIEQKIRFLIS